MTTTREQAKAQRRAALLAAAARLFADRGYERVSLEELGSAAGISGPAIYRHFPGKQSVLAAILVGASEGLLDGGRAVLEQEPDAGTALARLVDFHLDFAISQPDVIRVQDRDLDSLADDERHHVRSLQRTYVNLWAELLGRIHPGESPDELLARAHAAFGLMNSTPHSARRGADATRRILEPMALAALLA